jgi:DNA-binding CsgD family transcriptional regulator
MQDLTPFDAHLQLRYNLTNRQLEVIHYILKGWPNLQIANHIFVCTNTIKSHLTGIYKKLGVSNRAQMIIRVKEIQQDIDRDAVRKEASYQAKVDLMKVLQDCKAYRLGCPYIPMLKKILGIDDV